MQKWYRVNEVWFSIIIVHIIIIANVSRYKLLHVGPNTQSKYQTLVPIKIDTLRYMYMHHHWHWCPLNALTLHTSFLYPPKAYTYIIYMCYHFFILCRVVSWATAITLKQWSTMSYKTTFSLTSKNWTSHWRPSLQTGRPGSASMTTIDQSEQREGKGAGDFPRSSRCQW